MLYFWDFLSQNRIPLLCINTLLLMESHPLQNTEHQYHCVTQSACFKERSLKCSQPISLWHPLRCIKLRPLDTTIFARMKMQTGIIILFANSQCYDNFYIKAVHKKHIASFLRGVFIHIPTPLVTYKGMFFFDST